MRLADYGTLLSRLMLSAVFLWSGIEKALDWPGGLAEIATAGLPFPAALLLATILVQVLGGLSIAVGFWAWLGAFALMGFTLAATLLFHNFWVEADPIAYQHQLTTFLEHVAIIGGFISLVSSGSGAISLDRFLGLIWTWP